MDVWQLWSRHYRHIGQIDARAESEGSNLRIRAGGAAGALNFRRGAGVIGYDTLVNLLVAVRYQNSVGVRATGR